MRDHLPVSESVHVCIYDTCGPVGAAPHHVVQWGLLSTMRTVACYWTPPLIAFRKRVRLNQFLPQGILQRVPRPKECLEHYFRLLQSKWRPDQAMSQQKCMQNYLRLFEENMRPDIHKFTVKVVSSGPLDGVLHGREVVVAHSVCPPLPALSLPLPCLHSPSPSPSLHSPSLQSVDGSSDEQDQHVQVELSAYSGIKMKRANQQVGVDGHERRCRVRGGEGVVCEFCVGRVGCVYKNRCDRMWVSIPPPPSHAVFH